MKRKGDVPFWDVLEVNPRTPVSAGEKGTPPMLELITGRTTAETEAAVRGTLDEVAREGARRMIEVALQLEVAGDPESRAILRRLIPDKITVTPTERGWSYRGEANPVGSIEFPSGRLGERAG